MVGRGPDVGPDRVRDQRLQVLPGQRVQQGLDGGADPVDDGAKIGGLTGRGLAHLLERRTDGSTLRVPQHDRQPGPEACGRELHTAHLRRRHDIAGDANHE